MTDALQVHTTAETEEDAQTIARAAVEARLAVCAQVIGPITSTYWWEGKVETATEWLCLFKTDRQHYDGLEALIREKHPYEMPEILAMPVVAGSQPYLDWLAAELAPGP